LADHAFIVVFSCVIKTPIHFPSSQWSSPKICSEVTVKPYEVMSNAHFAFSVFTIFSDLHNAVFSWRFIVFADSSTNTAIFDFAETIFCTIFKFQQLCETIVNGSC